MTKHSNLDDRALLDLVEQHGGEDFLRELLSWALHQVMEAEVGEIAGAGKGERSPEERANLRNGLPPPRLGHAGRHDPAQHYQAARGQLHAQLHRAAPNLGEGLRRDRPGGLRQRGVHTFRGQDRPGHGRGRRSIPWSAREA